MPDPSPDLPSRKRGRPQGATRYKEGDARLIALVGDKLLAEPHLSTRAAISQVIVRTRGKPDANALRRIQSKLDRTLAVEAAVARREEQQRRREEMLRGLLSLAEFMSGGANFQRFMAKPEVEGFMRDTNTALQMFATKFRPFAEGIQRLPQAAALALIEGKR